MDGGRLADGRVLRGGEVGDETEDGEGVAGVGLGRGEGLFGRFAGGGVRGEGLGQDLLELIGGYGAHGGAVLTVAVDWFSLRCEWARTRTWCV